MEASPFSCLLPLPRLSISLPLIDTVPLISLEIPLPTLLFPFFRIPIFSSLFSAQANSNDFPPSSINSGGFQSPPLLYLHRHHFRGHLLCAPSRLETAAVSIPARAVVLLRLWVSSPSRGSHSLDGALAGRSSASSSPLCLVCFRRHRAAARHVTLAASVSPDGSCAAVPRGKKNSLVINPFQFIDSSLPILVCLTTSLVNLKSLSI